jgi:hypothetical protein
VVTLRCTQVVRERLRLPKELPEPPPSTCALGDWYIHLVRFGRSEFAVATSERSLLSVLLVARGIRHDLAPRLRGAVGELLSALGIARTIVAREISAMEPTAFGRTTNRRVLGSVNDLAFQATVHAGRGDDLLAISCRLAETPMSAIGPKRGNLGYPIDIARELLTTANLQ